MRMANLEECASKREEETVLARFQVLLDGDSVSDELVVCPEGQSGYKRSGTRS